MGKIKIFGSTVFRKYIRTKLLLVDTEKFISQAVNCIPFLNLVFIYNLYIKPCLDFQDVYFVTNSKFRYLKL